VQGDGYGIYVEQMIQLRAILATAQIVSYETRQLEGAGSLHESVIQKDSWRHLSIRSSGYHAHERARRETFQGNYGCLTI